MKPRSHRFVLLSDTHVGDRTKALSPKLLEAIRAENPDEIWHAGDVSQPQALESLACIAPSYAVQGNRDLLLGHKLPKSLLFEVNGLKIVLTHGHINLWHYLLNYAQLFITRVKASRRAYEYRLAALYPDADIIVYGHTHFQNCDFHDSICFLNPGAAYPQVTSRYKLQFMTLTIDPEGGYSVQRHSLEP